MFFASDARYVKLHMSTKTDTERTHSMKKMVQEKYGTQVHDMHIDICIYTMTFADGISQCMFILKVVKNNVSHFELDADL